MALLESAYQSSYQRNILLVGPSGVGKTAMVKELAYRTDKQENSIWLTTASTLIKEFAGGEVGWETNLSTFCEELAATNDYLFINNLKELFEVGQYMGNKVSMAEFLIPFLKRGTLRLITECTEEELAKIDLRSPMYLSLFQIIKIPIPDKGLEAMIQSKFQKQASNELVTLEKSAIAETLRLNQRFSPYSGLPGKPIRFLETILMNRLSTKPDTEIIIKRKEVIQQFSEESGLPLFIIDPDILMDVQAIKTLFNKNVYGQELAVDIVIDKLASVKTALTRTGKPISSFLFVGPTGVGKTELAKILSEFMFGHKNRMIRFDMSEYASPYAVGRLIGEPGSGEGQLTSAVRQNPFCVLLFDEIEKAHPSVYDLFLQILGEGRLTDQMGKVVNFCSSIIIFTSNIGADKMQGQRISYQPGMDKANVMQFFDTAVQQFFRPELYNRIDQVIPFAPLDKDTMRFVVEREINLLKNLEGIRFRNMNFQVDTSVLEYFAVAGYNPKYGARHLQRAIRDELTAPLASALNGFDHEDQLIVQIKCANNKVEINIEADPLGMDLYWETLEQITNADYLSETRRRLVAMQEGNYYIRLLNQLDIYEVQHKRLKEAFFKDADRAADYSRLLSTKERVEMFTKRILDLEQRFDLSVLDMAPNSADLEEQLDECKEEFFQIKLEIYSRLTPNANSCQLGIFGQNPDIAFSLYKNIFEQRKIRFQVHSVWHRDSWYNEIIEKKKETDGSSYMEKRETYLLRRESNEGSNGLSPDKESDVLVGLAIAVEGPCINLFLQSEHDHFLEWHVDEKTVQTYLIQISDKDLAPPENIHRKSFFKQVLASRVIKEGHLWDNRLDINREIKKWEHGEWIVTELEERYRNAIEDVL